MVLCIALLAIAALNIIKTNVDSLLVLMLFAVPFLGASALSFKRAIYLDRYFIFSLPFLAIITGSVAYKIRGTLPRNTVIIALILGSAISFPLYWQRLNVKEKPGIRPIAEYLNNNVKENEPIYVGSSFVYFTFKYYNETGIRPLLYADRPLSHFSGTALLDKEDIVKDLALDSRKHSAVWMLNTTGYGNYQPAVPDGWQKIEEKAAEDIGHRGWIIATKYLVQ